MLAPKSQHRYIHLPPIPSSFVVQLIEHLGNVMVAIVAAQVVVCSLKCLIGPHDGLIPLLRSMLGMVQQHVLQRRSEAHLSMVHGPSRQEVINGAITLANASMANARNTASHARKSSPNHTVGVALIFYINLHLDLIISLLHYYMNRYMLSIC